MAVSVSERAGSGTKIRLWMCQIRSGRCHDSQSRSVMCKSRSIHRGIPSRLRQENVSILPNSLRLSRTGATNCSRAYHIVES